MMQSVPYPKDARRGRGAVSNPDGRFEPTCQTRISDGWDADGTDIDRLQTTVTSEYAKTIISRNKSPDLPFDRSINAYRGCEHGCIYCYARPTHAYLNLSPGLDFESRITVKPNAAEILRKQLSNPKYGCKPIALGTNTDPYQPLEKQHRITRSLLEVFAQTNHPFTITTKSDLVLRDLDILAPLAKRNLVSVGISLTSLDTNLSRRMEPRASAPHKRLRAIEELSKSGIPTIVQLAPVIPAINDTEIESILDAARKAGATSAIYLLLRLPGEVAELFRGWLAEEFPDRADKVMNIVRSMRNGKEYESEFGTRMQGRGPYAEMIERRFALAVQRYGLEFRKHNLTTQYFQPPRKQSNQLDLF